MVSDAFPEDFEVPVFQESQVSCQAGGLQKYHAFYHVHYQGFYLVYYMAFTMLK